MKPTKIATLYNKQCSSVELQILVMFFAFSNGYLLHPFSSTQESQLISFLESNNPSKKDQV